MLKNIKIASVRKIWSHHGKYSYLKDLYQHICVKATADKVNEDINTNTSTTGNKTIDVERLKLIAFGNILIDYTAHLKDTKLLDRYNVSLNSSNEMDVDLLEKITKEALQNSNVKYPIIRGSALNTAKIIKKLGTEPLFFGAIGVEEKSEPSVRELLLQSGLNSHNLKLQEITDMPTGRFISLIYENSLACYANIGASWKFSTDFLMKVDCEEMPGFRASEDDKKIFYIEGFFIPERENVITHIVNNYIKCQHDLVLNLSANHIVKYNYFHIVYLAYYAKIIIGNMDEFEMLRECWGANTVEDLVHDLFQYGIGPKIAVITNGENGGQIIAHYTKKNETTYELMFKSYKAVPVKNVVDTTGCGDAFAAGFLHSWLLNRPLEECAEFASQVAAKVAGQIGCDLP